MATIPLNALIVPLDEKFILAYGEALLEWSYIENRLFRWFMHLTELQDGMARAIFFSARSYLGRSDMLAAAIESASFTGPKGPISRQIIEEGLQKANAYASFRNALAHGHVTGEFSERGHRDILVQGKHPVHLHATAGITLDRFKIAGKNFASLAGALSLSLIHYRTKTRPVARLRRLHEAYERLLLLPNEPDQEKPSQKQLGRLHQRRAAARKKSHT